MPDEPTPTCPLCGSTEFRRGDRATKVFDAHIGTSGDTYTERPTPTDWSPGSWICQPASHYITAQSHPWLFNKLVERATTAKDTEPATSRTAWGS